MDRVRSRIPVLTCGALMLCTCAPWGARAEFESTDSANLAAINNAVSSYISGINANVAAISSASSSHLPRLASIQSELQTLRVATGQTLPLILVEAQAQNQKLADIRDDADDSLGYLVTIDQTLDAVQDALVNQPYKLGQLVDGVDDTLTSLGGVDDSVDAVNESVETLTSGLSGSGQYEEDWGELPEFAPADIDESVSPYDDGQTINDRGSSHFKNSFTSFITEVYNQLDFSSYWSIEQFQGSLGGYLVQAPTKIPLTPSMSVFGFTVPPFVLDWSPLKSSQLLFGLRTFIQFVMVGVFGFNVFQRFASVI